MNYPKQCLIHNQEPLKGICIDLDCKNKSLICQICLEEGEHVDHKYLEIDNYFSSLVTHKDKINTMIPKLQKIMEVNQTVLAYTKKKFAEFQKDFEKVSASITNLYQFNQDISKKILNKDLGVLTSLSNINQILEEQHTQTNGDHKIKNYNEIQQQQKNFINLFSIKQTDFKGQQNLDSNKLLEKFLKQMSTKENFINNFNQNNMKNINTHIMKMKQILNERIKLLEVDVVDHLNQEMTKFKYPNQIQIQVQREDEYQGNFAKIDIEKDNAVEYSIQRLKKEIKEIYQLQKLNQVNIKASKELTPIQDDELLVQELKNNNIICEIQSNLKQFNTKKVYLIGVSGATRCGKGTLSRNLSINLDANIIQQDHYFDIPKIQNELKGNWECPEAINWEKFVHDIKQKMDSDLEDGKQFLIVDGFLLFSNPKYNDLFDLKIFLNIEDSTIYQRRMETKPVPEDYFFNNILKGYKNYKQQIDNFQDVTQLRGDVPSLNIFKQSLQIVNNFTKEEKKSIIIEEE
ncbi:P-loop containing nucleoside triphosphate hydrolase [Pseudocohnilembus persalinus]|uniref:p-loop containing nucleoside triphosphate hydrolase n=1 Tax=Pseudocohnilembus persalinus TaxID=266149 RepID=A0A0V0QJJ6_PSEPJ|nr:P-loop containing nucleoside triphosphate hydrolase [Pseudocohnilembus persalinus]|eukprot:KRX02374.1 P-loop containing nucleoside triphosphate hydrolase [Pseudocohnilembus persalinus]